MPNKEEIVETLSSHYTSQVLRAFGNVDPASKALEVIAKSLKEIYRYFEPCFFNGDFLVCKDLHDRLCFKESNGTLLYDKNILLNRTDGVLIIQVFDDNSKMILWERENPKDLFNKKDTLTYLFKSNRECFFANGKKIDITIFDKGSRFATQFNDLVEALQDYSHTKILKSSCKHFCESWADKNRLFFRGGGSGSNIPEKYMQLSLHEFLSTLFRGISMESSREYNVIGDLDKPKPVDIKIQWCEANRTALIEIKFVGAVKKKGSEDEIYIHDNPRVNFGMTQLKGYYDMASSDSPTAIIKSYLVVIDGRRNNLAADQITVNTADGMFYKHVDVVIDDDKKFHESILGFEKPIRMFTEPICL